VNLSVVVPVYNSEGSLPLLVERLLPVLSNTANQFELILVNDGSSDGSWKAIQNLNSVYPWMRGINLMRNYGQHNALLCGIRAARYEIIVTLDDDLQHPPEEIPRLLEELAKDFDVVYGKPQEEQHGLWRDSASRITKFALRAAVGKEMARDVSAYRAFRTQLRDAFCNYQSPFVSIDVLLSWATTRYSSIPVRHDPRKIGASNYNFRKLLRHGMDMLTGLSVLPLQLASLIGFVFTLFGAGVLIYVVARYFILGGSVPGFPFLASVIAIFSGSQLFALGIIGEYLARIHKRTMDRPIYAIRTEPDSEIDDFKVDPSSHHAQMPMK